MSCISRCKVPDSQRTAGRYGVGHLESTLGEADSVCPGWVLAPGCLYLLVDSFGGTDSKDCLQCRRPGFDPWVMRVPWRRKWLPTLVFLPGESHGQRSLEGYGP